MSLDAAGNYIFNAGNKEYRVLRMNIFKQREFITVIQDIFDEDGELILYSEATNLAQDWIIPHIQYRKDEGGWDTLKMESLSFFLDRLDRKPLDSLNDIFISCVGELLVNFTGTGVEVSLMNSNQKQEESYQEDQKVTLSQTLGR